MYHITTHASEVRLLPPPREAILIRQLQLQTMPKRPTKKRGAKLRSPCSRSNVEAAPPAQTDDGEFSSTRVAVVDDAGDEDPSAAVTSLELVPKPQAKARMMPLPNPRWRSQLYQPSCPRKRPTIDKSHRQKRRQTAARYRRSTHDVAVLMT